MTPEPELVIGELVDETVIEQPPELAGSAGEQRADVEVFDVVLAENLDPPFRHIQRYLWLETLAVSPEAAVRLALDWCEQDGRGLEVTGMLREGSLRAPDLHGLPVNWSLPVELRVPPGTPVRHPVSGLRVGFVATPAAEGAHLPADAAGRYRLLTRKPTDHSAPVCLAPLVRLAGWP